MTISIVLATYNGEKFIREQIDSILSQSFNDFEVIISDDKSTDDTYSIIEEYSKKDARIKIFQNKTNLGFLKNFEQAMGLCSGDYIACCDQDDIWEQNHLEILLNSIGSNDCIGANSLLVDEQLKSLNKTHSQLLNVYSIPQTSQELFLHECYFNLIQGSASLFKRELLKHVLPFPANIKFHDHWIALNASILNGCKYIPTEILKYRCHPQNITGFQKFHLFHAFQTISKVSHYRSKTYNSQITMLQAISTSKINSTQRAIISDAISFFSNLKHHKHIFSTTVFFIKNYPNITLCPRRKIKLFLYRTINIALFGIML